MRWCSTPADRGSAADPSGIGRFFFYEECTPAMRIYVGNLNYTVSSDDLRALFEPFGEVLSAEVQYKSRTGQSRGFGLVDMAGDSNAEAAISALNGRDHQGRPLTVNESRPRRTVKDQYASGGWYGVGGR
jgi:cold-inducible RNA-binding protein